MTKSSKFFLIVCALLFNLQKEYAQTSISNVQSVDVSANHIAQTHLQKNLVIRSVLQVSTVNPRYFSDKEGRLIYLTGSHTWPSVCDMKGPSGFHIASDNRFLDGIEEYGHNFTRLWTFENDSWIFSEISPMVYPRTGPGLAADGKPKYDLSQLNEAYFDRLKSRVKAAMDRGIYVSVVLFGHSGNLTLVTPMKAENNVNGIDGDVNKDGDALETRTLEIPAVTALQETYVNKVIATVNEFDNVLYEIATESGPVTTEWQYHFIRFIKQCESKMPKQHLIGMSSDGGYVKGDDTKRLFDSPADWIAPGWDLDFTSSYMKDPPAATGKKIVMVDTDHLWGVGGDSKWVWKCFTRGLHPDYMDPYLELDPRSTLGWSEGQFDSARWAMGNTLTVANQIDLANMMPHNELSSTRFCLANPGHEYLVYLPDGGTVTVDLLKPEGVMKVQWMKPVEGSFVEGKSLRGSGKHLLKAPFAGDAILYIVNERKPLMTSFAAMK